MLKTIAETIITALKQPMKTEYQYSKDLLDEAGKERFIEGEIPLSNNKHKY